MHRKKNQGYKDGKIDHIPLLPVDLEIHVHKVHASLRLDKF